MLQKLYSMPAYHQSSLFKRTQEFIRQNLKDPDLCPDAVAAAHHVSTRHLQRVYQHHGYTVAAFIRHERLDAARRDLADPMQSHRPIHAIATRWGFSHPAVFTRTFRAVYGLSPREYRTHASLVAS
ncbi:helix-turn-helix domain-containing protein [Streptomyces sp. NPDC003860]